LWLNFPFYAYAGNSLGYCRINLKVTDAGGRRILQNIILIGIDQFLAQSRRDAKERVEFLILPSFASSRGMNYFRIISIGNLTNRGAQRNERSSVNLDFTHH
jgi:hypothetical protein